MGNTSVQIDTESRKKIINIDKNNLKNYFVIANAGSGKTTILVNRMVAMVEAGIDVSKICAITFTKNAAAEFLDRFQKALRERAYKEFDKTKKLHPGELGEPTKEAKENCIKALKNINLCFLGTIDSFCNKVLSEFPIDAGIPSSSIVMEEDEEKAYYIREFEKISKDENSPLYEKFWAFDLLNKDSQNVFANSIKDVINACILNLQYDAPTKTLKEEIDLIIRKYESRVNSDIDELLSMESFVSKFTGNNRQTTKHIDAFNAFKASSTSYKSKWKAENILYKLDSINKALKDVRFDDEPQTDTFNFKSNTKGTYYEYNPDNELNEIINKFEEFKYIYSIDFMYNAIGYIKKSLKEQGKLTFNDYLLTFRKTLLEDMNSGMNIIKHIREKYSYFLIDESQDTSPIQTELFLYITSSVPALSPRECKPIPGSLFILGDPKQSIYRFRAADVNSYLKTKELFENVYDSNNEVLMLTKNFRSTKEMIEYFNETFKDLDNYELIPTEDCGIGGGSGLYKYSNYIDVIKTMLNNPKYIVKAKDEKENDGKRSPMFKDFMIITRNKPEHDEIIKELNANHIPVYIEGTIDVTNSNAVKSVYAVYKYIASDNIDSSGALYNLLASPLFGYNINQIVGKTTDNIPNDVKEFLEEIKDLKEINNPVILFERILESIKLFNKIDFSNIDYAYFVLENLKKSYANLSVVSINDAVSYIESFVDTRPERIMSLNYKPNAVYLANLHKVKGLEAPIVILYHSEDYAPRPLIRTDFQTGKSYVFRTDKKTVFKKSTYGIETNQYEVEEKEEIAQSYLEYERLRYVAATRARSYLLIDDSHSDKNDSFWRELLTDGFEDFEVDPEAKIEPDEIDASNICINPTINFDNTSTYEVKSPSKLDHERINNVYSSNENSNIDFDVRLKGTIIHRLMEVLVSSNNTMKKCDLIDSIVNDYGIEKLEKKDEYINMLNTVYDVMNNGGYKQNNGKSSDLLSILKDAECHCEVPFSYKDGSNIWYGNIDLLYIKNGEYFIVDYKTNLDGSNLEEKYKKQLEAYRLALKEILGVDATTYIYHIDIK